MAFLIFQTWCDARHSCAQNASRALQELAALHNLPGTMHCENKLSKLAELLGRHAIGDSGKTMDGSSGLRKSNKKAMTLEVFTMQDLNSYFAT